MLKPFDIKPSFKVALFLALAVNIATFVIATRVTQSRLETLGDTAVAISEVAAPSIIYLSRARAAISTLRNEIPTFIKHSESEELRNIIRSELDELMVQSKSYLALEILPDEEHLWGRVQNEVIKVADSAQEILLAIETKDKVRAGNIYESVFAPVAKSAGESITATIEHDAKVSENFGHYIEKVREETSSLSTLLCIVSIAIAMVAAFILFQIFKRNQELVEVYNELLSQKVSELDAYAGRVAHDLKNPLGAAKNAFELYEDLPEGEDKKTFSQIVRRNLERAIILANDLLAFARATGEKNNGESADVPSILRELSLSYELTAKNSGIELIIDPGAPAKVATSKGVLVSVLENLLRNAIKFMGNPSTKQIKIRHKRNDSLLRFEVQDTGPGIPLHLHKNIFEKFVRGNHQIEGAGLGLATAKKLVEAHGGGIGVESEPGSGTTFWFEVPLA